MEGSYNAGLVVTSILVAILASYTALDMVDRVNKSRRGTALAWLLGGGFAMGIGIWSMHFIGMLAFSLPIPTGYDPLITVLSMCASVASSTFALWLTTQATLPAWRIIPGGILMGLGIACMHYIGMEAMQMNPGIAYDPFWFTLSIIIAIVASWTALRVFFLLRNQQQLTIRLATSTLLAIAIIGMHYTGMAAADFAPNAVCMAAPGSGGVNPQFMAIIVTVLTVAVMGVVLALSMMDKKLESRMLRVRNAMLSMSLEQANADLSSASLRDALTRLPNRQLLLGRLETALTEEDQEALGHALLVIDIDDFKHINEAYGPSTGDKLLVQVGERLGEFIQPGELLARTGSDEFVLLIEYQPNDDVGGLASRILTMFNAGLTIDGTPIHLTACIGIVTSPDQATTAETLLVYGSQAMQQAKATGRNAWLRYHSVMSDNKKEQMQLLADLRLALEHDLLSLHYQPKLRARDGSIVGAEASIHWEHPTLGSVAQDRIISLAERGGLTVALGNWQIEQACAQLGLWHRAGQTHWSIAVNLSPLQFQDSHLLGHIRHNLKRHNLPARNLILEISEALLVRDADHALPLLNSLSSLGVGIAIDDFGTGYASLLHLQRLPASELKINHTFIQSMEPNGNEATIVGALIALGHGLELEVVADGVSNRDLRTQLERMDCDYLQGTLIGQAVNAARFIQLHAPRQHTVHDDDAVSPDPDQAHSEQPRTP